ncbi:hypothetical protein [Streptomyces sp. NPDC058632]|uniref:hypothetical protein n=1 Tax=unclassified Streptomyces TaxID=2593676 RepID=UPI003664BC86
MATAVAAPFRFPSLQVAGTGRPGPPLTRVAFTGIDPHAFRPAGPDRSLTPPLPQPEPA